MACWTPRTWTSLLAAVLLFAAVSSAAQAQAELSGIWSASRASNLSGGALRSVAPFEGRGIEITVAQSDGEIRVTEERRGGNRRQTRSYVLHPGREQELNRFGRDQTVSVRWDREHLVIEAAGKWRETWEVEGDSLKIHRQSLVHDQRRRTLVLSRQGAAE